MKRLAAGFGTSPDESRTMALNQFCSIANIDNFRTCLTTTFSSRKPDAYITKTVSQKLYEQNLHWPTHYCPNFTIPFRMSSGTNQPEDPWWGDAAWPDQTGPRPPIQNPSTAETENYDNVSDTTSVDFSRSDTPTSTDTELSSISSASLSTLTDQIDDPSTTTTTAYQSLFWYLHRQKKGFFSLRNDEDTIIATYDYTTVGYPILPNQSLNHTREQACRILAHVLNMDITSTVRAFSEHRAKARKLRSKIHRQKKRRLASGVGRGRPTDV